MPVGHTDGVVAGVRVGQAAVVAQRVHGVDPTTALHRAYGTIWGLVQRQASMQAFVDTFLAMSIVFLLVLPLLFIMKRPRHHRGPSAMH